MCELELEVLFVAQLGGLLHPLGDRTPNRDAIGCGWKPATGTLENLSLEEYHSSKAEYSQCSKCFRCHSVPSSLPTVNAAESEEDNDEYTSCGFLSDDSVDSDSDAEASKLALK